MSEIYSEISANEREPGEYFFKFQFFVHQVALTKDFFNITKPAVAIRFLDFPTMVIHGDLTSDGRLFFGKGKNSSFRMHSEDLRQALLSKPFFVMFIDSEATNVQMIASSNVNIGVMAQKYEFFNEETSNLNLRRNYVFLFDQLQNEVVKMDVSLGVSLVDREKQRSLQSKVQVAHPNIPGARITKEQDKAPMYM